jgi:Ca2+-binding RTX toxin-like protein
LLNITGGSGDDTFRGVAADGAYVLAGGAGNDQYIVAANSDNKSVVATGIEVIDVTAGTSDYAASQLHTGTFIIKDTSAGQQMQIDAGATMDLATINLSGLSFQNAATNIQIGAGDAGATALTLSGALFNTAQAVNITGSATIDDITGTANADIISGGAGADVLNGAAGADTLDGGAGADTLNGGTGADNITTGAGADTISVAAGDAAAGAAGTASTTGLDTVSDFTAGTVASGGDKIQHGGGASTIAGDANVGAAAAGTAAISSGTATFHADDDTLAEKITATEAAMTGTTSGQAAMFAHGGAAYVLITDTTDGCTANDVLIALTGIDTTATTSDVLTADGAGGFTIV